MTLLAGWSIYDGAASQRLSNKDEPYVFWAPVVNAGIADSIVVEIYGSGSLATAARLIVYDGTLAAGPNNLLATADVPVGTTQGSPVTLPLNTTVDLSSVAGVWIGGQSSTYFTGNGDAANSVNYKVSSNPYASGAPNPWANPVTGGTTNAPYLYLSGTPAGPSISDITINADTNTISGTGSFPNALSSIAISAGGGTDTITTGITSTSTTFNAPYTPLHAPFTSSSVDVTLTDSTGATASFTTSIGAPTGYQAVVATAPINTDPSQSVLTSSNVAGDQMLTATRDDNNLGTVTQNPDGSLKFTWDSGTAPAVTDFQSATYDSVNHLRGAVETLSVVNGALAKLSRFSHAPVSRISRYYTVH